MSGQITTKTSDLLANMALRLQAISDAVYEAGWQGEAREIANAAHLVAVSSMSLDSKIADGARAMLSDDAA